MLARSIAVSNGVHLQMKVGARGLKRYLVADTLYVDIDLWDDRRRRMRLGANAASRSLNQGHSHEARRVDHPNSGNGPCLGYAAARTESGDIGV